MNRPKVLCFIFSLVAIPFLSLDAGLSPLALKNVSQCFNKGYEYCSPVFGSAAQSLGLIENLRFYHINRAYKQSGERDFIKDQAPANDHFMQLILYLFPSPAGLLTTVTSASSNFGRYCEPRHVAALINFAHEVRKYVFSSYARTLPLELKKALSRFQLNDQVLAAFKDDSFSHCKDQKNKILTAIIKCIESEKDAYQETKEPQKLRSFYPRFFVEQIITSFFCHTFSDQDHAREYLEHLSAEIVDASKIDREPKLIEKADVEEVMKKENIHSLDEQWMVLNHDIFERVIPYRKGKIPISNGLCRFYNRLTNAFNTRKFPDCVEVVLRHICNFFLYNPISRSFDFSHVEKNLDGKSAEHIKNLKHFYGVYDQEDMLPDTIICQTPDKADAGDEALRSQWNRVVAELGGGICYCKKFDESDIEKTNEIHAGMLNIARVLKVLFNLNLPVEPVYDEKKQKDFIDASKKWFAQSIVLACKQLNPSLTCEVDFSGQSKVFKIDQVWDLTGKALVTIKDVKKKPLFTFGIHIDSYHAKIKNLDFVLQENNSMQLDANQKAYLSSCIFQEQFKDTIFPIFAFLVSKLFRSFEDFLFVSPLYQSLCHPINDADSMLSALRKIWKTRFSLGEEKAFLLIENILSDYPWEDGAAVLNFVEKLHAGCFFSLEEGVPACFARSVIGLTLDYDDDLNLMKFFPNIQYLYVGQEERDEVLEKLDLTEYADCIDNVKKIHITYSNIDEIIFPEVLNNLEELIIHGTLIGNFKIPIAPKLHNLELLACKDLVTMEFPQSLKSLTRFVLEESSVEVLNLPEMPLLEELILDETTVSELLFSGSLNHLKKISLFGTDVKVLALPPLPELRSLNMASTELLESIIFPKVLEELEEIDFEDSLVSSLRFTCLPKIKKIILKNTEDLEDVFFETPVNNLEDIDVTDSGLDKITFSEAQKLQSFNASTCHNLEFIEFTGPMPNLSMMTFFNADDLTVKIKGGKFCEQLNGKKFPGALFERERENIYSDEEPEQKRKK